MKKIEDFKVAFPFMYDNVVCGFCCPDGWIDLVWELSERIYSILVKPENEKLKLYYRIEQIKEKFGGLRFSPNTGTEETNALITEAEKKSLSICETCGKPGVLRAGGWIQTLCDEHAKGRKPFKWEDLE